MTDTTTIPDAPAAAFKPKKSVALSGVTAGNTALCTVGRTGNDLHYRGYDILDMAAVCEFEEIAYLLVHAKLPNVAELAGYKRKLQSLRGLLEQRPAANVASGSLAGLIEPIQRPLRLVSCVAKDQPAASAPCSITMRTSGRPSASTVANETVCGSA